MIAARSGRTDITNILLEGEHVNLDIQENVRNTIKYWSVKMLFLIRQQDGQLSISLLREDTQALQ